MDNHNTTFGKLPDGAQFRRPHAVDGRPHSFGCVYEKTNDTEATRVADTAFPGTTEKFAPDSKVCMTGAQ